MGSGVDEHSLSMPVSARVVRFRPTDHYAWNCLRVEVYGITPGMSLYFVRNVKRVVEQFIECFLI